MNKALIESKMARIGLDPSVSGFGYMAELLEAMPAEHTSFMELYNVVAAKHGINHYRVERNVRMLIERFYDEHVNVHPLLCPNMHSGRLTNSQFMCRLRMLINEDAGYNKDGSQWVILEHGENTFEVRVFATGGNFWAKRGTRDECLTYIMNGGLDNVV